jgi:hypothetical protein
MRCSTTIFALWSPTQARAGQEAVAGTTAELAVLPAWTKATAQTEAMPGVLRVAAARVPAGVTAPTRVVPAEPVEATDGMPGREAAQLSVEPALRAARLPAAEPEPPLEVQQALEAFRARRARVRAANAPDARPAIVRRIA